jgi:hypothetical protein
MISPEAERFANDLKTKADLRAGMVQHAGSMAEIVAFAGSRGYSFTTDGVALDHSQLEAVSGGITLIERGQPR